MATALTPTLTTAPWVPATLATPGTQPLTDVDGGGFGRSPTALAAGSVTVPAPLSDPALAIIQPVQPDWDTPSLFGKWGSGAGAAPVVLTFSFYGEDSPAIANGAGIQPAALDDAHRQAVRMALAAYADIANLTFVEVAETADTIGQLRFIDDRELDGGSFTAAYTSEPLIGNAQSGLVGFDVDRFGRADDLTRGGQTYGLFVHEIGHALGLSHSFDDGDAKPAAGDVRASSGTWNTGWTVMSYTAPGPELVPSGERLYPLAPMVADVAVIQSYYGAKTTTRTGDDIYSLDGRFPAAAIWDAGGTDTLDASGATVTLPGEQTPGEVLRKPGDSLSADGWFSAWEGVDIDLRPGTVGPQVAVAFGVALENAVGSRGHDRITGTDAAILTAGDGSTVTAHGANRLDGGAGNDTIFGLGGDDTLVGGAGDNLLDGGDGEDTALYAVTSSAAVVTADGADLVVTAAGATDRLRGIERLAFTDRVISAEDAVRLLAPVTHPPVTPPVTSPETPTFGNGGEPTSAPATPATPSSPSTPVTPVVIDPSRRAGVFSGGVAHELAMDAYAGPVPWVKNQYIGTDATEAISGSTSADFINSAGGTDAIDAVDGDDVLDGGTGSNFLTGGAGQDTFFVDGRGGGVTWSTVTDLEANEWVTAWGWQPGVSKLTWVEMAGAEGSKGATAHIDLDGNGSIDMSMTLAGKVSGAVVAMPGQVGSDSYLAFRLA